jgi:hypothetical protein
MDSNLSKKHSNPKNKSSKHYSKSYDSLSNSVDENSQDSSEQDELDEESQESEDHSSDSNAISIENKNEDHQRAKHSHNGKVKKSISKNKIREKFNGPTPSQHGNLMNNTNDRFNDVSSLYYQGQPMNGLNQRLGNSLQIPFGNQGMHYPQLGNPMAPLDNYPMMNPVNNMVDPMMLMTRQHQNGSQKQEEAYNLIRNYYKNSFFPFSNDLLADLVSQIDMYVQILIQTLLSTKNVNHQYQLYLLLYEFTKKKEAILKPLKLPKFEVPWINPDKMEGKKVGEPLKMQPQVSFYQSPLLEYAYRIVKQIGK